MVSDPAFVMRSYIIDIETYGLAEQAGMFCEELKDRTAGGGSILQRMQFTYYSEEPYSVEFIWDLGELRVKLVFMGDRDNSVWSVSGKRIRMKGTIFPDVAKACTDFMTAVDSVALKSGF